MRKIVKENLPIKTFSLSRQDAINLMKERGEVYKVEHIDDLDENAVITFYQQGEYIDMCVGPHLTYTKQIKAFKLRSHIEAFALSSEEENSENLPKPLALTKSLTLGASLASFCLRVSIDEISVKSNAKGTILAEVSLANASKRSFLLAITQISSN